jgi:glycosyltransferase involved in cell wall biosynthesis
VSEIPLPKKTSVDVLVPSWRRTALLEQALESIEGVRSEEGEGFQIEVYVVDEEEGSGAGPAAARNLAAMRGRGEFIALLDDDDRWAPSRLCSAIGVLRAEPSVALVCGDAITATGRALQGRLALPSGGVGLSHRKLALDCFVCASTVTLRRIDWEAAGGMNEELRRAEDYDLWLRLTRDGRTVHVLPDVLAHYGEQGERLSEDLVAMARATRTVLGLSAQVEPDRFWRDRLGRLDAIIAHGLAREGSRAQARSLALDAVRAAPTARVAWTALGRAMKP